MKFAIVRFPGTWSEWDCFYALQNLGQEVEIVSKNESDLGAFDAIVLPGGFSYGDHLRTGAMAAKAPVMQEVNRFATQGRPVFGSCNGFQILCEAGLLPGVLQRNNIGEFRCKDQHLRVERTNSGFTNAYQQGQVVQMPISHGEGLYYAPANVLQELEETGRVLFRYCGNNGEVSPEANPNGSLNNIAGVVNEQGNVLGMMPHPERASDPLVGGTDGILLWRSIVERWG